MYNSSTTVIFISGSFVKRKSCARKNGRHVEAQSSQSNLYVDTAAVTTPPVFRRPVVTHNVIDLTVSHILPRTSSLSNNSAEFIDVSSPTRSSPLTPHHFKAAGFVGGDNYRRKIVAKAKGTKIQYWFEHNKLPISKPTRWSNKIKTYLLFMQAVLLSFGSKDIKESYIQGIVISKQSKELGIRPANQYYTEKSSRDNFWVILAASIDKDGQGMGTYSILMGGVGS